MKIELRNFSAFYLYKKQYYIAIDDIDLTIEHGSFVVAVGPSGSGKTTLLKSIAGLLDLTQGKLTFDGEDMEDVDPKDRNLAYVSQEYSLYPSMTVFDNIAFPLKVMRTPFDEIRERVYLVAKELGIDFLLTRKPRQLSGGQQQRVAIARSLIKNPTLFLYDEPFSNLEPETRLSMQALVKSLAKKYDQTVVFVTHDLIEAFTLADKIVVLDQGKVIEEGFAEDLKKKAKSPMLREFLKL
ncbi:MAG: ABC transporter ATP-binding protein [Bacilli bacterium]|nr:ABC transporter ATP-binding protein [Bacilli bacterium]